MTIPVSSVKQANITVNSVALVFKCTNPKSATKVGRKFNEASYRVLKEKGVLPVHRANPNKLTKVSLPGFVATSKGSLQEDGELSKMRINDGCNLNVHKLMKRSSQRLWVIRSKLSPTDLTARKGLYKVKGATL